MIKVEMQKIYKGSFDVNVSDGEKSDVYSVRTIDDSGCMIASDDEDFAATRDLVELIEEMKARFYKSQYRW